jgi:Ca-activated chloride channel family protein
MQAVTRFTFDKVSFDKENRVHLVLGLHAPRTEWQTKRSRVCIVPVVDVSGSMGGQKLEYAQKSVRALIEQLQSDDYCGLVVFSTQATLLGKPRRMDSEGKAALTNLVLQLRAGGSTHFSGGFELALDTCKKLDLPSDTLVRIIMFTDGQANCGLTGAGLLELVQKNRGSVTVSAFGYGADADQELLADFSKEGAGNYAYIQEPAEALPAFGKELGGLLSTYARNVLITMTPGGLHHIDEVVSADKVSLDLPLQIRLPDILSEQEHNVVLAMTLAAQAAISVQPVTVCEVKVEFDVLVEMTDLES